MNPPGSTMSDDIYSLLKQDKEQSSLSDADRVRKTTMTAARATMVVLHSFYDSLERAKGGLGVIKPVMEQLSGKLPDDAAIHLAKQLHSVAEGSTRELALVKEDVFTVHTTAVFTTNATRGLSTALVALEKLTVFFGLSNLKKGLRVARMVVDKIESRSRPEWIISDSVSYLLYKQLWDGGLRTHKEFLTPEDYASNKHNVKLITEGIFYKLVLAYYSFAPIQRLLSVCVVLLGKAEKRPDTQNLLQTIYGAVANILESRAPVLQEKFSLQRLGAIPSDGEGLWDRTTYADKNKLRFLGQGATRKVYALDGRKVLKLAINPEGIGQNKTELEIFTDPKTKPITTKIYQTAPDYSWIVSEIVKPLKDDEEFEKLVGFEFDLLCFMLRGLESRSLEFWKKWLPSSKYNPSWAQQLEQARVVGFVLATRSMATNHGLSYHDLTILSHWGRTPDGKVVVLDYGYTKDMALKRLS